MYQPQYHITDKLLSNIVKAEVATSTSRLSELAYNARSKLTLESKGINLFHLAHMLQVSITVKDAEKLAEGRKLELDTEKLQLLTNFRNILEFNRSNVAESYTDLDPTVLLHLNKIILTGWKESWEVKLRAHGDNLDPTYDDWFNYADQQLSVDQVQPQLSEVLDWFHQSKSHVNDLIRIGVLVKRLVEIMPFVAGNKFTIIAATDLLLNQFGYAHTAQVPVVRNFDVAANDYGQMWDITNRSQDLTQWLELFVGNISQEIRDAKHSIDTAREEEEKKNTSQPFLDLNKRQLKILRYLQNIPTVKREDYCQMMDVSTMTAFRDLSDLVRKKLLKVEGQGRGTRYMLVSR